MNSYIGEQSDCPKNLLLNEATYHKTKVANRAIVF